jgi:chromosomal replication initiation ATPase DnaA
MVYIKRTITTIITILIISNILSACTTSASGSNLISANTIAQQVGAHYGDSHAKISGTVRNNVTDNPPHDPMYLMTIVRKFHENGKTAHLLVFFCIIR